MPWLKKIGIISDIHSNLPALEIALHILKRAAVDQVVVCGDVVGYGESPNECCQIIRELNYPVVAGNHDWAVAGLTDYKNHFSDQAREGVEYTLKVISPENLSWLASLPLHYAVGDAEFVHATLVDPEQWWYPIVSDSDNLEGDSPYQDVRKTFDAMRGQVCFVGHSHIPAIFLEMEPDNIEVIDPEEHYYDLKSTRAVIDVSSVGIPRMQPPQATVVLYDMEKHRLFFERFLV